MIIAELDPAKRNARRVLSDEKQELRNKLIMAVDESLQDWTDEIQSLYKEDQEFQKQAMEIIKTLIPGKSTIRAKTTWGPQDSKIQDYVGVFTKNYGHGCFNMKTAERGEFTIGSSCLCYLQVLSLNAE